MDSPADSQVISGYQFFKVFDEHQLEYILLAKGGSDDVYMVGKLAAFQIQNLLVAYKERFDKDNFIKNLLLDNLLLVDIYNRAKKLHIETNVKRVVFLIETKNEKDTNALETMRSLFSTKTKDFITAVDEKNIILVREVKPGETYEDLEKTANTILDMLNTEAMSKVRIAFGTIGGEIKDVSRSYIIGAQSATCSESIREWIDVEIALKYSKRVVLALRHRARCLLRTDVTLCREHSRELIVYIKGILHIGRKSAHLVGNGPSRIVIETYRRIGSRVLATARKRYHMISDGLHRKEKIKPVGVGIFVFAQEIHPCLGRIG